MATNTRNPPSIESKSTYLDNHPTSKFVVTVWRYLHPHKPPRTSAVSGRLNHLPERTENRRVTWHLVFFLLLRSDHETWCFISTKRKELTFQKANRLQEIFKFYQTAVETVFIWRRKQSHLLLACCIPCKTKQQATFHWIPANRPTCLALPRTIS